MNSFDWHSLQRQLAPDLHGYTVFVETSNGGLCEIGGKEVDSAEVVGLAAAWFSDRDSVSSQEHAEELLGRLSERTDIAASLAIARDVEHPRICYYVRVRPRQADDDDHVLYNGVQVRSYWPELVEQAQAEHDYLIEGKGYARIRYGDEAYSKELDGPIPEPCHDCAVRRGQYHVGRLCDMEECPRCHGQVIGCDCPYDDDADEDADD